MARKGSMRGAVDGRPNITHISLSRYILTVCLSMTHVHTHIKWASSPQQGQITGAQVRASHFLIWFPNQWYLVLFPFSPPGAFSASCSIHRDHLSVLGSRADALHQYPANGYVYERAGSGSQMGDDTQVRQLKWGWWFNSVNVLKYITN